MEKSGVSVWTDDEVATQVLTVVREADDYVILVGPYLDLDWWGHAKTELELALRKGIRVVVILRSNTRDKQERSEEDIKWLIEKGVEVRLLENLHAKVYLNERDVVLGSANLTQASMKNSHEIVLLLQNDEVEKKVRYYVTQKLVQLSKPIESPGVVSTVKEALKSYFAPAPQIAVGHCLRCRTTISFDLSKPLCEKCYGLWAPHANRDYPEKVCHRCGERSSVSYGKPLCARCYRSVRA